MLLQQINRFISILPCTWLDKDSTRLLLFYHNTVSTVYTCNVMNRTVVLTSIILQCFIQCWYETRGTQLKARVFFLRYRVFISSSILLSSKYILTCSPFFPFFPFFSFFSFPFLPFFPFFPFPPFINEQGSIIHK